MEIVPITPNSDFMKLETTIGFANTLLQGEYGQWQNNDNKQHTTVRLMNGYTVPSNVAMHLDFISPTVRFPINSHITKIKILNKVETTQMLEDGKSINSDSSSYNTPLSLRELYHASNYNGEGLSADESSENNGNIQAFASFIEQYYDTTDLQTFWEEFGDINDGNLDYIERVPNSQPDGYGVEAELDSQTITGFQHCFGLSVVFLFLCYFCVCMCCVVCVLIIGL